MDEYVAGVATYYNTNDKMLAVAEEKLEMLKEDSLKLRAKDLHELLRAWENYHRILTAEAHMKHIQFREESRYPGFYYRTDKNFVDEEELALLREFDLRQAHQEVDLLQAQAHRPDRQVQAVQGRGAALSAGWL
jgi:succinate dehydrogenase/fumarate reductase flavoprotein subunit